MTTATAQSDIIARLFRTWRRERRVLHLHALGLLTLAGMAIFVLDLALDRLMVLPGSARLVLMAASAGVMAWLAHRCWWSRLSPFDPARVALRVERQHPYLRSLVVSHVQLSRSHGGDNMSMQMIAAVGRQAQAATEPLDFDKIVDTSAMRRAVAAAVLCVVVMMPVAYVWRNTVRAFLSRMVHLRSTHGYLTGTWVYFLDYPQTVRQGDPVTIRASVIGPAPSQGEIFIRDSHGQSERFVIQATTPPADQRRFSAIYTHQAGSAREDLSFYLRIGVAQTATHQIKVLAEPRLLDGRVALAFPSYTGMAASGSNDMNFAAVRGTVAQWNLHFDRPLAELQLLTDHDRTIPGQVTDDGLSVRVALNLEESFAYHFRLVDREHHFEYASGPTYFAQVQPDAPPRVVLTKPEADEIATVNKRVDLVFQASDDFGIAGAWIVYSLNDEPEQRIELKASGTPANRLLDAKFVWRPADKIALHEGDVLAFAVEAADNRPGTDQIKLARSAVRRITFVSTAEYLRHCLEQAQKQVKQLEGVREEEDIARQRLDNLGATMTDH